MARACLHCGSPLPEGARFCPACGTAVPVTPPPDAGARGGFPGWWLVALGGVAAMILAVVFIQQREGARAIAGRPDAAPSAGATPGPATPTPEPMPAPTPSPSPTASATPSDPLAGIIGGEAPIPAPAIAAALDRLAANMTAEEAEAGEPPRLRGPLRVNGIVVAIDGDGTVALAGRDPGRPVIAQLPDTQIDALDLLTPGMAVRLTCRDARAIGGTSVLEGCRL